MRNLREVISEAEKNGRAIGHFNVSNLEMLHGVAVAAKKVNVPVIIGVSEGEREAIGLAEIVALVKTLRQSEGVELFLNADHTGSVDKAKEALAIGFDAVLADGSTMPWDDNISLVKAVVEAARQAGREVLVEGELGQIGAGSEIRDEIVNELMEAPLTTAEQAAEFVRLTGVDLLAPAVGNFHGMLRTGIDPALNINLIKEIKQVAGVPLVLHGASGNTDEEVRTAIQAGMAIVHVSTELRKAYRDALKLSLADNPDEVAPYKFSRPAVQAVEKLAEKKLRLFTGQ